MARKPLQRGDIIKVSWLDIQEDSVGNPDAAKPAARITYGLFWAQEIRGGIECLITTTTEDDDGHQQCGWACFPMGIVTKIDVIKRKR